ncbi:MAG: choice-of-anchor B family protein, partial [Bacteroidota bacterium]
MKHTLLLLSITLLTFPLFSQTPCVDGMAGIYPCDQVDLLATMTTDEIGGAQNQADIWGWTSAVGREFAIVTKSNGTAFVEVTDPVNPVYLGDLPTHSVNSLWRDAKVFNNYAFIVSEASAHGMQIFDLTQLLDVQDPPVTFEETTHYNEFGNAHNIAINEDSGFAYAIGTSTFAGGLHIVDINDPLNPVLVGAFGEDGYTHDCQVVNYHGPDPDYCDSEISFNCNEESVTVVDVTQKDDCQLLDTETYENVGYTHQGWLTEDHRYFIVNDETDELQGLATNTKSFIWDVQDLDNIELLAVYEGTATSIDHNMYIRWNQVFQSNYRSGLRILDAGRIAEGTLTEIGYFDCQPSDDGVEFSGTWSNYCYFESGIVIMTDMFGDFFILRPRTVSADGIKSVGEGTGEVTYNVYFAANEEEAEINVDGLPTNVFAGIDQVNGIGAASVVLLNTDGLAPGSYDFTIVVSIGGEDQTFPATLEILDEPADEITLLGPSDEFTDATPVFTWEDNFENDNFLIEISSTPDFSNIVVFEEVVGNTFEFDVLLIEGTYYWRVTTIPQCNEEALISGG